MGIMALLSCEVVDKYSGLEIFVIQVFGYCEVFADSKKVRRFPQVGSVKTALRFRDIF